MIPAEILQLDASDELAHKREAFCLPRDTIYLNGNSLGPLPASVPGRLDAMIQQEWGEELVASWNSHGWIDSPQRTGEKIAHLLGAGPGQVICCDSVSINLFKLLTVVFQLRPDRHVILSQADNFPSDLYIAQGVESLLAEKAVQLVTVADSELLARLDGQVAVLYLTQINFRSAAMHDIEALTRAAHEQGALVIWDLSHSTGAVPLALDAWQVDFAVGCGYKFLHGGPGAPAFIYANARHAGQYQQALQGWMGHAEPFAFSPDYQSIAGIKQFLSGTPNMLSLASLESALDVFAGIDSDQLYTKVRGLSELFAELLQSEADLSGLRLESPVDSKARGAHLAYSHPAAWPICRALHDNKVIVDYREPDLLRFGFSPLVLSFAQIWQAVKILQHVVADKIYKSEKYNHRLPVT